MMKRRRKQWSLADAYHHWVESMAATARSGCISLSLSFLLSSSLALSNGDAFIVKEDIIWHGKDLKAA
jgi:hypothetical protein